MKAKIKLHFFIEISAPNKYPVNILNSHRYYCLSVQSARVSAKYATKFLKVPFSFSEILQE